MPQPCATAHYWARQLIKLAHDVQRRAPPWARRCLMALVGSKGASFRGSGPFAKGGKTEYQLPWQHLCRPRRSRERSYLERGSWPEGAVSTVEVVSLTPARAASHAGASPRSTVYRGTLEVKITCGLRLVDHPFDQDTSSTIRNHPVDGVSRPIAQDSGA